VVVNNAAHSVAALAETATSQQMLDELNTNVVGMQRLNRAVLPGICARRSGLFDPLIEHPRPDSHAVHRCILDHQMGRRALAETYRCELKLSGVDVAIVHR